MPKMPVKRGEYLTRTFVCPAGILKDCENRIVQPIRRASGYKANRSRLLQAMLNLAAASATVFDPTEVVDQRSFEKALENAIVKRTQSRRQR